MAIYGYDSYYGVATEPVWGTYQNPTLFLPLIKETSKGDIAWVERKSELRSSRFPATPIPGRRAYTGSMQFSAYPHAMGRFIAAFLGTAVSDVVLAPGAWRHEFVAGASVGRQLSSTVRKGLTLPRDGSGFKVNEMNFTQDNEKTLLIDIVGAGKQEDAGVAEVAVFTETLPFLFYHATLTANAGATTYYCDNVDFKFSQNYKNENWKISGGQTIMSQPFSDRPIFGGTFTIDFENWDEWDLFRNFSDVALRLTYVSSEEIVAGQPYTMIIDLPKVRYKNNMPEVGASGLLTVTNEFECFADNIYGYTTPIHIYLHDGTAAW